jgi:PAS domain S-box-containing protein
MMIPFSTERCPISGLRILRKPEWTDVSFGGSHRANISLLDDRIIVSRPSGFITLDGLKQSLGFTERLASSALGEEERYVRIEDFSNLKGTSIEARRFYILHMKKQNSLLGLIFCNVSTMLKISVKLAKGLNIAPFEVDMVHTYSEAVGLALHILEKNLQQTEETRGVAFTHPIHDQSEDVEAGETPKKNHWGFDERGYSLDQEIIHGNILHSISKGFMKEMHISMIEKCMQEAFESIQPTGQIEYFVASVSEFERVNPKARILFMNLMKQWHERHPFKMFIFYGSNRFMRTAANLARPFMPFRVETVKDLNSALEMVVLGRGVAAGDQAGSEDGSAGLQSLEALTKEQYVEELLGYIANIRWDSEGLRFSSQPSSTHPLSAVFDAILLIKSELDQLFKERDTANEALRQVRDELERRVEERTAKLVRTNERLRAEIKERKAAVTSLTESEDRFRFMADLSPFPISIIDAGGRYAYLNPKFSEVFGYTLDDIAHGRDWFRKAYPDPAYRRNVMAAWISDLQNKTIYGFRGREFQVVCKDGTVRTILFKPVTMKDGKQFVVYEDLTEQRRAAAELKSAFDQLRDTQAQLIQSGKLASIGQLASGVAHELNQPLMVIRGTAQMIKRKQHKGALSTDELPEKLEPIERNTKRMMNIINHLRTFSRQSQSDFQLVDVNTIVEDSLLMVGEQLRIRNIELNKGLDKTLPKVRGDANQLEQVFLNLVTNARDAVEERMRDNPDSNLRGTIEIITRSRETSGHFIEMLITDKGAGISREHVDRIFDPFFTTKDVGMGTGLGLSISYGIIKDHGGEIEVAATGPEGTTFRIILPVSKGDVGTPLIY